MNNSNEGNIIFVDAFKLAMKTIESLHKKVNEQNDIIESLCDDIENIKSEINTMKNSSDKKIKIENNDEEQLNDYIDEMTKKDDEKPKEENKKILQFITNKSEKNKIENNDKNRIRRNINKNDDNDVVVDDKNIKIQKLVSSLLKKKNECDDEINKIQIENEDDNNNGYEEEEEKKDCDVKIRRRGARF